MKKTVLLIFLLNSIFLSAQNVDSWDSTSVVELSEIMVRSFNLDDMLVFEQFGSKKKSNHTYLINAQFNLISEVKIPKEFQNKQLMAYEIFLDNRYHQCAKETFYMTPIIYEDSLNTPYIPIDLNYEKLKVPSDYKGKIIIPTHFLNWIPNSEIIYLGFGNLTLDDAKQSQSVHISNCINSISLYPSQTDLYQIIKNKPINLEKLHKLQYTMKLKLYFKK